MTKRIGIRVFGMVAAVGVLVSPVKSQADEDACRAELLTALKDVTSETTISSVSAGVKKWFCSDSYEQLIRNNDARADITVPIKGVPVKFGAGSNSAESRTMRTNFCASAETTIDDYQATSIAKQVVSPAAVAVYKTCTERTPASFINLTHTLNGSTIILTAKFTPLVQDQRNPIIEGLTLVGATGGGGYFSIGKRIPIEGISEIYQRTGPEPVTIGIHTTAGSKILTLPRNLEGQPAGNFIVKTSYEYHEEVDLGDVFQDLTTGNHHCSRNCGGEPTRTHYTINLSVPDPFKIKNPSVACYAGPCPWSGAVGAALTNSNSALGYFDVWSRPTTWRLTARKYQMEKRYRNELSQPAPLTYGRTFTVRAPSKAASVSATVTTPGGEVTFNPTNTESNTAVQRIATSTDAEGTTYTFKVKTD